MNRIALKWIVLSAALLAPTASFAQVACTRPGLQAATDLYLAAQAKGDPSGMPLAMGLAYMENQQVADIKTGVIQKPLKIDFHRTLIDPATCQSFTEAIITDKTHPYVLGTRLRVNHDKIVEIESMVTQEGDWLFNADNYFKWSPGEDWGVIPAAQRGIHTGKGVPEDGCEVGVPSGVNIVARRFVVDENIGAVVAFCTFGVGGLPDTHLFRVEKGKLRFVHTLTHVPPGRQVGGGRGGARGGQPGAAPPNNPAPNNQKQ
jgi:hypothetical protein